MHASAVRGGSPKSKWKSTSPGMWTLPPSVVTDWEIEANNGVSLSSLREAGRFAELTQILGTGEAACLAVAEHRKWLVACDEKRVFLREARKRLGADRILNTAGLYVHWIRAGVLSVAEADAAKGILESHRFKLSFGSFRDVI